MKNINRFPHCFWFVDYINISSVRVFEELVCMHGAYHDPITGKVVPAYFETDFTWLYELLHDNELIYNADKALEAILASVNGAPDGREIELKYEEIFELQSMVIRLSTMMEDYPDKAEKFTGFYIEDAYPMERGLMSFHQYVPKPDLSYCNRRTRIGIMRKIKSVSGHLVVLAMRYEYYTYSIRAGKCEEEALFISSLLDIGVLEAAKSAFEYIRSLQEEDIV